MVIGLSQNHTLSRIVDSLRRLCPYNLSIYTIYKANYLSVLAISSDLKFINDGYRILQNLPLPLNGVELRMKLFNNKPTCVNPCISKYWNMMFSHRLISYNLLPDSVAVFFNLFYYTRITRPIKPLLVKIISRNKN